MYGINLGVNYKDWSLNMLFQGAAQVWQYTFMEAGTIGNFTKDFYDNRWTEDNPTASFPRTYNRSNEYWVNQPNTFWLHKTDYVRLKNIELGYTVPKVFTKQAGIERVRVYISAYNLLTFSPDMKDYDPENTSGSGYNHPLNKVLNFGVNVTF